MALEDENGDPITFVLDKSLEPGASTLVTVGYLAGSNAGQEGLPLEVTATIDPENRELECVEDNNSISGPVEAGEALADLRLEVTGATGCSSPKIPSRAHDGARRQRGDRTPLCGDRARVALYGRSEGAGRSALANSERSPSTRDDQAECTVWGAPPSRRLKSAMTRTSGRGTRLSCAKCQTDGALGRRRRRRRGRVMKPSRDQGGMSAGVALASRRVASGPMLASVVVGARRL